MRNAILLATLILIATNVVAAPIKGAGATSCGLWIEDRKTDSWYPQIHWIQGYISSYDHYLYSGSDEDGIFGNADAASLAAWMDKYCRENPLASIYEGTTELVTELSARADN